jgi:hypothetical protein
LALSMRRPPTMTVHRPPVATCWWVSSVCATAIVDQTMIVVTADAIL